MTAPFVVRVLGGLSIETEDGRASGAAAQPRRLALIALIARSGERGISRERILSYLWADAEPEQARRALNQALYALRRDLGNDEVVLGTHELRLNGEVMACDVLQFEADLKAGRLEEAVARYAGPFLDGFRLPGAAELDRWVDDERAQLARRYGSALERLARSADQGGDLAAAVGWWRRLAAIDPLDARVAVGLMQALAANGDCAAALQHARIYEVLVTQELDLPADAAVLDLARRVRAGEVTPRAVPAAPAAAAPIAAAAVASDAPAAAHAALLAPRGAAAPPADRPAPAPTPSPGLAVLPFADLSGDPAGAGLAAGIAEEIIHRLTAYPELGVVARSAAAVFAAPAVELAEVSARLGVATVLEGSVRLSDGRVRVTVRLVDVASRQPRWSARVDGDLDDAFELQDAVAECVVARLTGTHVAPRAEAPRTAAPRDATGRARGPLVISR